MWTGENDLKTLHVDARFSVGKRSKRSLFSKNIRIRVDRAYKLRAQSSSKELRYNRFKRCTSSKISPGHVKNLFIAYH